MIPGNETGYQLPTTLLSPTLPPPSCIRFVYFVYFVVNIQLNQANSLPLLSELKQNFGPIRCFPDAYLAKWGRLPGFQIV
jgi:hypothetical protein